MWTNNPVADAARHDREMDKALEEYPVCARCGETIYPGEDLYEMDSEIWCESCVDNMRASVETWMDRNRGLA